MIGFFYQGSYFRTFIYFFVIFFISNCSIQKVFAGEIVSYQGVSLSDSKVIVKQKLGKPTYVALPPKKIDLLLNNNKTLSDVEITTTATKKEIDSYPRKELDFNEWIYIKSDRTIFLNFGSDTEGLISISCYVFNMSERKSHTCAIKNINILESKKSVFKKLGTPSSIEQDGQTTVLDYSNLSLRILTGSDGVFNIVVKNF